MAMTASNGHANGHGNGTLSADVTGHTNGHFHSQTHGECDLETVRKHVLAYLAAQPDYTYRLVIGTDSQAKNSSATDFVIAFIIHRVGAGDDGICT